MSSTGVGGDATKVMSSDDFEIHLVQPKAAVLASAVREAGGNQSPFLSTPEISPIAADGGIPSEPLRQFMTAKREGYNVFYTPDSAPATPGNESYEFQNTGSSALRQKGKAAAICPGRSTKAGQRPAALKEKAGAAGASAAGIVVPQTEEGSAAGRGLASTGLGVTEHGGAAVKKEKGEKASEAVASPQPSMDAVSDTMASGADCLTEEMAEQSPVAEYEGLADSSSASSSLGPTAEPPEDLTEGPTGDPTLGLTGNPTKHAVDDAMEEATEDDIPGLVSPVSVAEVVGPLTPEDVATPERVHPLPSVSRGTQESTPHIRPMADGAAGRAHYQMQTPTLTPISGSAWHSTAIDQQQQSQESPVPEAHEQLAVEQLTGEQLQIEPPVPEAHEQLEVKQLTGEQLETEHFTDVSPLQSELSSSCLLYTSPSPRD